MANNLLTRSQVAGVLKTIILLLLLALIFNAVALTLIWAHHLFVTGMNPMVGSVMGLLGVILVIAGGFSIGRPTARYIRHQVRFTPVILFIFGGFVFLTAGIVNGLFIGDTTPDIQLHDTFFWISQLDMGYLLAAAFGIVAAMYQYFPKIGRYPDPRLAAIHFWLSLIAAYLVYWPVQNTGLAGMPRRYFDYGNATFNALHNFNRFGFRPMLFLIGVQCIFLINLWYSAKKGRKVTV